MNLFRFHITGDGRGDCRARVFSVTAIENGEILHKKYSTDIFFRIIKRQDAFIEKLKDINFINEHFNTIIRDRRIRIFI